MAKRYTKDVPLRAWRHFDMPTSIKRIDFDHPVILFEVRIGNCIVALEESDTIHLHLPAGQLEKISCEERSRYTFDKSHRIPAEITLICHVDREATVTVVTADDENIPFGGYY